MSVDPPSSAASAHAEASARLVQSINAIDRATWNDLARRRDTGLNPFVTHEFLSALEDSGSVGEGTGWHPHHIELRSRGGTVAVAPMYLKSHSYGEYVFDHAWAKAFENAGGEYYPKLQVCVPFTPATGPRLLTGTDTTWRRVLAGTIIECARQLGVSSAHLTFADEGDLSDLCSEGFLERNDQQFHWWNHGYENFDGFLGALSANKRKSIRRERRDALCAGIEIQHLTGTQIQEHHWDEFFTFYMDTGSRKWGQPYLTREFFSLIGQTMSDSILLIMAKRNHRYIAGALNFLGPETIYGRNWGAIEQHPFLHFELCYYQAIDFAIARRFKTVEAGAQGEHKLARGYLPRRTQSAHWIANPGFRDAVARYLHQERLAVVEAIETLREHSPFKAEIEIGRCHTPTELDK